MSDQSTNRDPVVVWRVHPAAERWGLGLLVLGLVLALGFLAGIWMGRPYWGAFAFIVLFLSLEAFFLPSRYVLSAEGVEIQKPFSKTQRSWSHFRRIVFDSTGITLSPFARKSWLETYRALRLRYPSAGREDEPSREKVQQYILGLIDRDGVTIVGLSEKDAGEQGLGAKG